MKEGRKADTDEWILGSKKKNRNEKINETGSKD